MIQLSTGRFINGFSDIASVLEGAGGEIQVTRGAMRGMTGEVQEGLCYVLSPARYNELTADRTYIEEHPVTFAEQPSAPPVAISPFPPSLPKGQSPCTHCQELTLFTMADNAGRKVPMCKPCQKLVKSGAVTLDEVE